MNQESNDCEEEERRWKLLSSSQREKALEEHRRESEYRRELEFKLAMEDAKLAAKEADSEQERSEMEATIKKVELEWNKKKQSDR